MATKHNGTKLHVAPKPSDAKISTKSHIQLLLPSIVSLIIFALPLGSIFKYATVAAALIGVYGIWQGFQSRYKPAIVLGTIAAALNGGIFLYSLTN